MAVVYEIINAKKDRKYIGCTKNYKKRMQQHFSSLRGDRHFNKLLQADYNKFGEWNFYSRILLETSDEEGFNLELDLIKVRLPYYNINGKNGKMATKYIPYDGKDKREYINKLLLNNTKTIVAMLDNFDSIKIVCEYLNENSEIFISRSRISKFIKSNDIKIKDKNEQRRITRALTANKNKEDIIRMYTVEDMPISYIEKYYKDVDYDIPREVIKNLLIENNIEIKSSQYYSNKRMAEIKRKQALGANIIQK